MRHVSFRNVATILTVGLTLLFAQSTLLAYWQQEPPDPPLYFWYIDVPYPGEDFSRTSSIPGYGEAGEKEDAFIFTVFYVGGQKQSAGTSTSTYTWSTVVTPPAGLNNKWPLGDAMVTLYADFQLQDWIFIDIVN